MIEKPTIIVTSLGRTGTRFFANLFANVIPDSTSLHEPDVLGFFPYRGRKRVDELTRGLRVSGVYNMTVRKLKGDWSLVRVSDARVQDNISEAEAARKVFEQRCKFIDRQPGSIYVESSLAFYGLIDVLPKVFNNHRLVYIVRDGRDWIRSKLAWGEMYNKGGLRALVDHTWPNADQLEDDPYYRRWTQMSRFEQLCWAWARLNRYALDTLRANPDARLFRFEDLFQRQEDSVEQLLLFCAEVAPSAQLVSDGIEQLFRRKIHASNGSVPVWDEWTLSQREQFKVMCGSLMADLNYEFA